MSWPALSRFNRRKPPAKKPLGEVATTRAGYDRGIADGAAKELERQATKLLAKRR